MQYKSKVKVNELLDNEISHMKSVYERTRNEHWLKVSGELESIKADINQPYETKQEIWEKGFFYGSIVGVLAGITVGFLMFFQ